MFTKAIVRAPGPNFAAGLTSGNLGAPDFQQALAQHAAYCHALEACGLDVVRLAPDERYPDSTFVEDTAVLTTRGAVITRPGAASRSGETEAIEPVLRQYFAEVRFISEPGTVDGGDVCQAGEHFFIGVSRRTNEEGAKQLARFLESFGYSSSLIDIRGISNILHLKSGLAYLGNELLLVVEEFGDEEEFSLYHLLFADHPEEYAANSLLINGKVLIPAGFDETKRKIEHSGYQTIALEMSEFQKMDGGLSCLSLRF